MRSCRSSFRRIKEEFESVVRHLRPPRIRTRSTRRWRNGDASSFIRGARLSALPRRRTTDAATSQWPGVHHRRRHRSRRVSKSSREGSSWRFNDSPLAAEGALEKSEGYAATPLTGVWANYPYLHNGSVPTLYHLLGPVVRASRHLQVMAARRLDRDRVGQLLYADPQPAGCGEPELAAPIRRRPRLVQHRAPGMRQRRPRHVAADSHRRESPGVDRVPENALSTRGFHRITDAIVVGAGPAGLATSRELSRAGIGTSCWSEATRSLTRGPVCTTAWCCTPVNICPPCPDCPFQRDTAIPYPQALSRVSGSLCRHVPAAGGNAQ